MKLSGKVAIVTGSSKGIGREIARQLGKEGAKIVLNGRDENALRQTLAKLESDGISATAFQGDISRYEDCEALALHALSTFGRIDILVNNAGISAKGFFENFQPEIFPKLIHTNIIGSLFATKAVLPQLKQNKGSLIFISSLSGLHGMPHQSPYSLTKMAQTAIAESLRAELYNHGVHVGVVYVGVTQNDPDKKIYFSDGAWRNLKNGLPQMADTQERVAKTVLRAILWRQFKTTVGWKGRGYYYLAHYFPGILDYAFRNNLDAIERNDT
ncbi:MAG: SDR family oxidoreductase [Saprospiraceae bacterium]